MDFQPTQSQQMTRRAVQEFVHKEVAPISQEPDKTAEFPLAMYRQALALEVLDITLPEALGGIGDDFLSFAIALEEFASGSAALAHSIAATEAVVYLLSRYGSNRQQQQYLRPLRAGEMFAGAVIWDPDAGSDPTGRLHAFPDGDGHRLSGTLPHVPLAPAAGLAIVFAMGVNDRISAFIVEKQMPGLTAAGPQEFMGMRGFPFGRLTFRDVFVSSDHRLGSTESGSKISDELLMRGETAVGAIAVGLSRAALEAAVKHSKARIQFGKPLAALQATQNKIADMAAAIQSARLLVYDAAFSLGQGKPPARQTAMAKLIASEMAVGVCREAVQIHGGYGYVKDYPVERLYRDALFSQLYPTVNEVQRKAVAQLTYRRIR